MRVTISGAIGEGKTTLAAVIVDACYSLGYTVFATEDGDPENVTSFLDSVRTVNAVRERNAAIHKDRRESRVVKVVVDNTVPAKSEETKNPYVVYVDGTAQRACPNEEEGRQWLWFEVGRNPVAEKVTLVHHAPHRMIELAVIHPDAIYEGLETI